MAKLVSQVYAEALFGLGVENGLLDTLLEELNLSLIHISR